MVGGDQYTFGYSLYVQSKPHKAKRPKKHLQEL